MEIKKNKPALAIILIALVLLIAGTAYYFTDGFTFGNVPYSIYVDKKECAILSTKKEAKDVLSLIEATYITGDRDSYTEIGFKENVTFKRAKGDPETVSVDKALTILTKDTERDITYKVDKAGTLEEVALSLGIPAEKILEDNPDIGDRIAAGKRITVHVNAPLLTMVAVRKAEMTEEIPYETVFIKSDEAYLDIFVTQKSGENGKQRVTYLINEVNGKEKSREIAEKEILLEPVTREVIEGTKRIEAGTATGTFRLPVDSYKLGTVYGYRTDPLTGERKFHNGTDFQTDENAPVYACDGGKVVKAGWDDSYGNYVVIDHGNLLSTLYAHNTELLVKEGDLVSKGTEIAKVGMTGDATGFHCHLEMYNDGQNIDPRIYVVY
ncbi:MAG: peptidoglycan DD-metalloendopeptidase family protein [Clostridia bacterium]|nr:peptidoglycan DD-metalloendopeptidase family protein [Clostridia bacterium]